MQQGSTFEIVTEKQQISAWRCKLQILGFDHCFYETGKFSIGKFQKKMRWKIYFLL